jgi:hypothetical protein
VGASKKLGCFAGEGTCVIVVDVLKRDVSIVSKELVVLMEEEGDVSMCSHKSRQYCVHI